MEPAPRPRLRIGPTVALAWVVVAVGLTFALGPTMGLRGWMWLFVHHTLCLIGAGWELQEDARRYGYTWPWQRPPPAPPAPPPGA